MKKSKTEIKITGIRTCFDVTKEEMEPTILDFKAENTSEMMILPLHDAPTHVTCLLPTECATDDMLYHQLVAYTEDFGDYCIIVLQKAHLPKFLAPFTEAGIRIYTPSKMREVPCEKKEEKEAPKNLSDLMEEIRKASQKRKESAERFNGAQQQTETAKGQSTPSELVAEKLKKKRAEFERFVYSKTPAIIEEELNREIIGQPELTKAVADYLYYHAMRQIHSSLPPRPMMIAGPSGSGKTEVWRAAERLYGKCFKVKIIDGSRLTCEGWKGDYKLSAMVDNEMIWGGILVVDEFDKLAKPKITSTGDNVSYDLQTELLKMIEGEGQISARSHRTDQTSYMGFVFVGAFDWLRAEKRNKAEQRTIGFGSMSDERPCSTVQLDEEDYLMGGVVSELLGRISTKVVTNELTDDDYIKIVRNPGSRVATLQAILMLHHNSFPDISDADIKALIDVSKANRTGVRWVSAQVENLLLESIRDCGLRDTRRDDREVEADTDGNARDKEERYF